MVAELKNYQAQVNAYRFENERLDKQISDIKQMWFQSRRTGMTGQPLGVIKETNDEDGMMYNGGGMQMDGVMWYSKKFLLKKDNITRKYINHILFNMLLSLT